MADRLILSRKWVCLLSLIAVFTLPLDAGIEAHFCPASNKSAHHQMAGIDFIYMINLDERPEKYVRTMQAFEPYEIYPYRFSAVNGWKLSFEAMDELGIIYQPSMTEGPLSTVYRHVDGVEYASNEIMKEPGVTYFSHCLSRGAIGCLMSHLSVLQDAYDSGYKTIWVMEDDVEIVRDPHEISHLIQILDSLAPDWDIFFTDPDIHGAGGHRSYCGGIEPRPNFRTHAVEYYRNREQTHPDIVKLGLRFGSHSMVIRRGGIQKLLDYFKTNKLFFPYDMEYHFPTEIKRYASTYDIVTNIGGGASDNAQPTYAQINSGQ